MDEEALLRGLALNMDGLSMACMGIAAVDMDNNGTTDLLVTNFANERIRSTFKIHQVCSLTRHSQRVCKQPATLRWLGNAVFGCRSRWTSRRRCCQWTR